MTRALHSELVLGGSHAATVNHRMLLVKLSRLALAKHTEVTR
jgi:hypothetical protein